MLIKNLLQAGLIALMLSACGGSGTQVAEGGIGGTGISMGPITGFGSIIQNGVRYDVSQASFIRNGQAVSNQDAYRVGEVVTIRGQVNANGTTGTAEAVEFSEILQGEVTAPSADNRTILILGQTVRTDALTILHGFTLLTDLIKGNVVQVSGTRNAAGVITASSLALQQVTFTPAVSMQTLEGSISQVTPASHLLTLNGISVDYSHAQLEGFNGLQPQTGQYVRVLSQHKLQGNTLFASSVSVGSEYAEYEVGTELELEGLITEFTDAANFSINGQPVITTRQTSFENGSASDLKLNATIEVDGTVNPAGVLVADEISIRLISSALTRELEGRISRLNMAQQEFSVLGNTFVVDNTTILLEEVNDVKTSIRFTDLRLNDQVEVKASQLANGKLLALRIDRESTDNSGETELKGVVSALDASNGTLQILGVLVQSDTQTEFESDGDNVTQTQFFAAIVPGQTVVKVEGTLLDNAWIQASTLEINNGDD